MATGATSSAGRARKPARDKLPNTPDPVEIAMIAAASGSRAASSVEARALLEKQARLIDSHERLARADLRHRGWQIISERVSAVLKGLTALAGLLLLIGAGAFLWSAQRASGIVVDAFSVPPEMDRRGMTGAVIAGQLLDKMTALEAATLSARAPSSYENSWSDIEGVEVPYAGVSLGQLRREARAWLGSETHLKGEVIQLRADQVAIAFRVGSSAGRVQGSYAQFDQVQEQAALKIFEATQPYRYSVYLTRDGGRTDEANAVRRKLLASPKLRERLWALHGLAGDAPTREEALALYERALRLQPDFLPAIGNMGFYALQAGHEEKALAALRRSAAAFRKGQYDYNQDSATGYGLSQEADVAVLTGDLQRAAQLRRTSLENAADAVNTASRPFAVALALAELHDLRGARAVLAGAGMLDPAGRAELESKFGPLTSERMLYATATGDATAEAADLVAQVRHHSTHTPSPGDIIQFLRPWLAVALARSGRAREAQAVVAPVPDDNDVGLRARALAAAYIGDHAGSDALFSRAVARTPSLPAGHFMWAEALLLRGDTKRAIEQAQLANRKGPRWAEPLKLWGDALLAAGRVQEAETRYAAAAERAPRWGKLHMQWASALWMLGQRPEALGRMRAAADMDLTAADRRLLHTMWGNARARLQRSA
jgi:tetratricopeptide (TPR) repeat protein